MDERESGDRDPVRITGLELDAIALGARALGVTSFDLTVSTAGGGKEIVVLAVDADGLARAS